VLVLGRFVIAPTLPDALRAISETDVDVQEQARLTYLRHVNVHVGVWCGFIATWVALEIAIVAQGIRAYRRLMRVVRLGTQSHA